MNVFHCISQKIEKITRLYKMGEKQQQLGEVFGAMSSPSGSFDKRQVD